MMIANAFNSESLAQTSQPEQSALACSTSNG